MSSFRDPSADEGGLSAPAHLGPLGKAWWWFHFLVLVKLARLRFVAVLAAIGALIVYWDTLKAYYDRWTRPTSTMTATASGLEWFCPMHPQIVRDNAKDKCPICFMPLSKRTKSDAPDEPLPAGIVSRVQLAPYRVLLAGAQTVPVAYRRLVREITTVGNVEFDERLLSRVTVRAAGKSRIDRLFVNVTGQQVRPGDPLAWIYSPELANTAQNLIDARKRGSADLERNAADRLRLWGIDAEQIDEVRRTGTPVTHLAIRSTANGHVIRKYQTEGEYVDEGAKLYDVADLSAVWIEAQVYEDQIGVLKTGLKVQATAVAFPGRTFTGQVALVHPHLDPASRTLRVRFDIDNPKHELLPGMYATVRLQVPVAETDSMIRAALEDWRDRTAVALAFGTAVLADAIAPLVTLQHGLVLAVPEGAVIDTGSRQVVYRQTEPGTFEGVEVRLGPRCDAYYPVLAGLSAGDEIVTTGSFLIDAETRLNPAAGSIYIGGSSGSKSASNAVTARQAADAGEETKIAAALAKLNAADRRLAEDQRFCAVLPDSRLGSMGTPTKLMIEGRPVFLCCSGCESEALAHPAKTLGHAARRFNHRDTEAQRNPK
jgi:Cu(I)/Ag(I) efflux system membrane fusion protein